MKKNDYIRFDVATYALPLVLCALHNSGVDRITITQEDYGLVVSIDAEYLENICYGRKVDFLPQDKEVLENGK